MLKIVGCWVNGITCGSNHSQNGTDSCRETCSQFHDGHTINKKSKSYIRRKPTVFSKTIELAYMKC